MMDLFRGGDAAMNLIGLILIAVLSGGIVAVSLRLRASSSRLLFDIDHLTSDEESRRGAQTERRLPA